MKKYIILFYNYVKSNIVVFIFFLISYYFAFIYVSQLLIKKGDIVGHSQRGKVLISNIVELIPGGRITCSLIFLILGIYILILNTKKIIFKLRLCTRTLQ